MHYLRCVKKIKIVMITAEATMVTTHNPGMTRRIEFLMWETEYLAFSPHDVRMIYYNLLRIYGDHADQYTDAQIIREIEEFYNN